MLVFGDTNSTLAGAEAAGATPIAHIEAGLRSFDLSMPEERNRIAVDRISQLLFCPDERSARQLESEGVDGERLVVGDVMADVHRLFAPIAAERSQALERLGLEPGGYILVTVHREANVRPERLAPDRRGAQPARGAESSSPRIRGRAPRSSTSARPASS